MRPTLFPLLIAAVAAAPACDESPAELAAGEAVENAGTRLAKAGPAGRLDPVARILAQREDLDLTGRQVRVGVALRALRHLTGHAHAELVAHVVGAALGQELGAERGGDELAEHYRKDHMAR